MDEKQLKRWVGDNLHDILGYTENTAADFIIEIAKKTSSPENLFSQLSQINVPLNEKSKEFTYQLFEKLPRRMSQKIKQQEIKKPQYSLINMEDFDDDENKMDTTTTIQPIQLLKPTSKQQFRKKNRSEKEEDEKEKENENENEKPKKEQPAPPIVNMQDEDDLEVIEQNRLLDLKEREEYEVRLKAKDKGKTKKATEAKLSKKAEEETELRKRLNQSKEDLVYLKKAIKI